MSTLPVKTFYNIFLLILLDIKRTMLLHVLYQSVYKECHVYFKSLPIMVAQLTWGGDGDICTWDSQISSWNLYCLLFHKKYMHLYKQP